MKIRNGFVSNSSSSSFVVIGSEWIETGVTARKISDKEIGRAHV